MKSFFLLMLFACAAAAQITYPVNVETNRFTFKLGTNVTRNVKWPRHDGGQLQSAATNLVILVERVAATAAFNPATHKLDAGTWIDDAPNQTATFTRLVVPLTQGELDENTRMTNLRASIATLRTWANDARNTTVTSGNHIATTQTIVNRLGTFFDRFADLLEVQGIKP